MRTLTTGRAGQQQERAARAGGPAQPRTSPAGLSGSCAPRRGNLILIPSASDSRKPSPQGPSAQPRQDLRPLTQADGCASLTARSATRIALTRGDQMRTDRGDGIQILHLAGELDLATANDTAARGHAAITGHTWLLLLDLTRLSFCDARGLSALVRIANHADKTGCRYGLIAPQPQVAKVLRICRLDQRMPVFATIDDALAHLPARSQELCRQRGMLRDAACGGIPACALRTSSSARLSAAVKAGAALPGRRCPAAAHAGQRLPCPRPGSAPSRSSRSSLAVRPQRAADFRAAVQGMIPRRFRGAGSRRPAEDFQDSALW